MTLRLAYLCGEYPRATDTFIQREVAGLRSAGMDVATIAVRRPSVREQGTDEQKAERERTHYLLPCSPWRLFRDHAGLMVRSPDRYLRAIRTAIMVRSPGLRSLVYQLFYFAEAGLVAAHLRRCGIRHLHNHAPDASGYVAMLAAELDGMTYSMTLHGFGILSEPKRWRLSEKLERCLFAICVSWHARSQAMLWSSPSCWDRFHVVHCGINVDDMPIRRHEGPGNRLLFVGRFDPVKGIPVLLDAIERLVINRTVHLDLVGDGPERQAIEEAVRKRGLDSHITFHGFLSQRELRLRLVEADVCVMTSFSEGIPVVLMEAMAAGVPVVAPKITGIPELVDDGINGYLTIPGHVPSLVERLEQLLDDPAKRSSFGEAGRRKVEMEFSLDTETARLAKVVRAHLEGTSIPPRPEVAGPMVDDHPVTFPEVSRTPRPARGVVVE